MGRYKGGIGRARGRRPRFDAAQRFRALAEKEFRGAIAEHDFPCLGAKAALNAKSYKVWGYRELAGQASSRALANDLHSFVQAPWRLTSDYATFIAVFQNPGGATEAEFERRLWLQLSILNEIDARSSFWDARVSSDPA